ncbi:MAG: NADH-dependent [FeFe] hydrogenase, group A6 [Clostridiales bacterium]|nr:NADH-dependent [FeFe] hydrogenase, group A6 [Clostridiales bacterium]
MINLNINNLPITVEEGTTIIEAARQHNINIPNLCYVKGLHTMGACRICVVEVEGARTLQAACITKVREGMVVKTNTAKVRRARKVLYELMLSDHAQDCLSCTRNQSCEFQAMGKMLGVETSRFEGARSNAKLDACASITRDLTKCILCRRCVTVCQEIQGVCALAPQNRGFDTEIGPGMGAQMGAVNCAFCGQCTVICPVGALRATDSTEKVWEAIGDPEVRTVVQVAPAVRVALGESFGLPAGTQVTGKMAAALRQLGFDDVFDTNFTADLTIMEEGTELLTRVLNAVGGKKAVLPMITSCSPGWVKYVEHAYPKHLDHLSTCKSPHTMLGALAKSYYAEKIGTDPKKMFVVSVMPCTAKKTEIERPEMRNDGMKNVDAVITTRELAKMISSAGIDFVNLEPCDFDNPLGMSTGAADIFGLTGGVMEAALRTVYELVTGRELPFADLHVTPIVGLDQVKEAALTITDPLPDYKALDGVEVRVAVTSGLAGAKKLMEQIAGGESPYHFIEVMGCPNGCIMGGGQPRSDDPDVRTKRLKGLYTEDEQKALRKSHQNPYIAALYEEYLGKPNGHVSHTLLHTHYVPRGRFNQLTEEVFVAKVDKDILRRAAACAYKQDKKPASASRTREEVESARVLELESENRRLRDELQDTLETVDIMKSVFSQYVKKVD